MSSCLFIFALKKHLEDSYLLNIVSSDCLSSVVFHVLGFRFVTFVFEELQLFLGEFRPKDKGGRTKY